MSEGEFQFIYTAQDFPATFAFYRDGLGFAVLETWDRGPNDRGAKFQAASGVIVVTALPAGVGNTLGRPKLPQGVSMGVEVEAVEAIYRRALEQELSISQPLTRFPWGERGFTVTDPNGIEVYLFSQQGE